MQHLVGIKTTLTMIRCERAPADYQEPLQLMDRLEFNMFYGASVRQIKLFIGTERG